MARLAIQLPEGASLNRTGVTVDEISKDIRKIEGVHQVTVLVANDTIAKRY